MEKKNLINIKTFEEFKSDNTQHYTTVVIICKDIIQHLKQNGITRDSYGMVVAGKWLIDGNINTTDLISEDDKLDETINFQNSEDKNEYVIVDISGYGKTITDKPGDYEIQPVFESEYNLDIDSITYFHGDVDNAIANTKELDTLILEIIEYIKK